MDPPVIKASADGPYLMKGPVTVVDPHGNQLHIPPGKSLALCRCGASRTRPLCDGSHNAGFSACEPAPEAALRRFAPARGGASGS